MLLGWMQDAKHSWVEGGSWYHQTLWGTEHLTSPSETRWRNPPSRKTSCCSASARWRERWRGGGITSLMRRNSPSDEEKRRNYPSEVEQRRNYPSDLERRRNSPYEEKELPL